MLSDSSFPPCGTKKRWHFSRELQIACGYTAVQKSRFKICTIYVWCMLHDFLKQQASQLHTSLNDHHSKRRNNIIACENAAFLAIMPRISMCCNECVYCKRIRPLSCVLWLHYFAPDIKRVLLATQPRSNYSWWWKSLTEQQVFPQVPITAGWQSSCLNLTWTVLTNSDLSRQCCIYWLFTTRCVSFPIFHLHILWHLLPCEFIFLWFFCTSCNVDLGITHLHIPSCQCAGNRGSKVRCCFKSFVFTTTRPQLWTQSSATYTVVRRRWKVHRFLWSR